jgi:hypothetical protein
MMLCFPLAFQRVSLRQDGPLHPAPAHEAALGETCGKSQLETFSIVDSTYGLRIFNPEKPGRGKARWPCTPISGKPLLYGNRLHFLTHLT